MESRTLPGPTQEPLVTPFPCQVLKNRRKEDQAAKLPVATLNSEPHLPAECHLPARQPGSPAWTVIPGASAPRTRLHPQELRL